MYILKVILVILCFSCILEAKNSDQENPPIFVSMGANCEVACRLRESGLRKVAYPFDWIFTRHHLGFLNILNLDFLNFTNPKFLEPNQTRAGHLFYWGVEFLHDYPFQEWTSTDKDQLHLEAIKAKYDRRIERFRKLRKYEGKVFFIRTLWAEYETDCEFEDANEQIKDLKRVVKAYFPKLDYTLVVVLYNHHPLPPIKKIKGVKIYKMDRLNAAVEFPAMFNDLLKTTPKSL